MNVYAFLQNGMKEMKNFTKKAISGFLSLVIAASAAVALPISGSAEGLALGDVNGDSLVNSADALAVLTYSVGKREFTKEEFSRAEVNDDGKVNSADALDILRYSVGLIESFKASGKVDASDAIAAYNKAIEKVKSARPSYTFMQTTSTDIGDVKVSTNSALLTDEKLREIEESMKEQYKSDPKTYTKIVQQNSNESVERMVGTIDASRLSEFASVECIVKESGNYSLTIRFKNETNPGENSLIVKTFGLPSYKEAKEALEEESSLDGVRIIIDSFDFSYEDCVFTCDINPTTSEITNAYWSLKRTATSKVTTYIAFVKVVVEMTGNDKFATTYSNFGY